MEQSEETKRRRRGSVVWEAAVEFEAAIEGEEAGEMELTTKETEAAVDRQATESKRVFDGGKGQGRDGGDGSGVSVSKQLHFIEAVKYLGTTVRSQHAPMRFSSVVRAS
jgi:hypothetical protein